MIKIFFGRTSKNEALIERRQRGVTSIEYALLAALIGLAIVAGVTAAGGSNASLWTVWTNRVIAALTS